MKEVQEINSWRIYSKVLGNRITVELPKNLDMQEVEVIIIPIKAKPIFSGNYADKEEWKEDFLSISKWDISEDDIKIDSWKLTEF